jgi:S-DNA-T family DNA segregation ATPase FtsK/SpoIIIE
MSRNPLAYLAPTEHRRLNEFIGLLLATMAILIALSLISFNPADPSFNVSQSPPFDSKPANFIGVMGAYLADGVFQVLGYSSFLLPVFLGIYAFCWLSSRPMQAVGVRVTGMALLLVTLSTAISLTPLLPRVGGEVPAGGFLGKLLADHLDGLVNPTGSIVILIASFLVSLFLSTTFSFSWAMDVMKPRLRFVSAWSDRYRKWQEERAQERERKRTELRKAPKKQSVITSKEPPQLAPEPQPLPLLTQKTTPERTPVMRRTPAPIASTVVPEPAKILSTGPTDLPSSALLHPAVAAVQINEDELRARAVQIEQKTREFEVEGGIQKIHPGPVVTTFEFKPEPGVKYARITALGDDLCLALEAESVRIDRIPGKGSVGIEVPNDERVTITLREIVESAEYQQASYRLPLALGKDITGKIVVSDLQKMPHLLMAGSTGTGKSVSLNAMVLSLLFRARPDQVKMIMIDPKRLELGLYQDIPHLLVPVVTEPKIAQNALRWAVTEMETRYKKLARRGVRTLDAYNEQIRQLPIPGLSMDGSSADAEDTEPLPFIVIVIDELADLMMTAAREVEESITRLAQMARAVGIHLILATQRPSVDVITGLIKANFPARVSFRVASKVDSRTILDSNGAEQLLGRGDMLFLPPGSSRLMRVHGPLVTEEEVTRVVEFLKKQGKPAYNEHILEAPEEAAEATGGDGELDDLYDEAVRLVIEMGKASTSALQRRLRIGYGRAASILDGMERAGIIGPPDKAKARAVLIKKEDYFSEN